MVVIIVGMNGMKNKQRRAEHTKNGRPPKLITNDISITNAKFLLSLLLLLVPLFLFVIIVFSNAI